MGIVDRYSDFPGGFIAFLAHALIRFLQFVLSLAVIGLYAQDLSHARLKSIYADSHWVYAVLVASLSATLSLLYFIPFMTRAFTRYFFPADAVLALLWIALFGDFGRMYIGADPQNVGHGDGPGIQRMKNAVWVDFVCAMLWVGTAVWGLGVWWWGKRRGGRSVHTGRAAL